MPEFVVSNLPNLFSLQWINGTIMMSVNGLGGIQSEPTTPIRRKRINWREIGVDGQDGQVTETAKVF